MKVATTHRTTIIALALLMPFGLAKAQTTYVWTGKAGDALDVDGNWNMVSAPCADSDQPTTPTMADALVFDGETWSTAPKTLYARKHCKWGSIVLKNGTLNWQNDANNQGNYSWSGTDTLVVGDGDATPATANFNVRRWNEGGTEGTKTYVINSDGTLASRQHHVSIWSNGAKYDTVMRLVGGHVSFSGALDERSLTGDAGDYAIFESEGSTFTFAKGGAGQFDDRSDVEAAMGEGKSFRPAKGIDLELTDNGTTWTITAIDQGSYTPGTLIYRE